jgi:N-acetylglucosamine-6-phosphate deacetylase
MTDLVIINARIIALDHVIDNAALLIQNGRIARIGKNADFLSLKAEKFDAAGRYIAPGLIDLHIHGLREYLIDDGPDSLAAICRELPRYGVTGILAGVCPLPAGKDAQFLHSLAQVHSNGTQILGFHLEGPFLSLTGALPPEAIGRPDPNRVRSLIEAAGDKPAIFSISPEMPGIVDLLPIMTGGIRPAFMTHTMATVKQTQAAIEAGVRHATHFYDVFPAPPVTDPGVRPCGTVEAILADERVSVDFILDGEHVDPVAIKMTLACKGPGKVCLITDANKGAGSPPGIYKAFGYEIEFKYPGAPARMTKNAPGPGGLAGSGLTLDRAVRNAVKMLGVPVQQAIRMASANPAAVLRLETKGQVAEGFDADLIMLDNELNVCKTWIGGEPIFSA